jgi:hypothetical protein
MTDYPYGPTWVSAEPWGYAPYHYGRWANVGNQWYWIPDTLNSSPTYSPAMVAFVPFGQNEIGWVPLGPGDAYAPRYYNSSWQPYYLSRADVRHPRVVNLNVPGAVTVVSLDDFTRDVDWKRARKADGQMLAHVNPVLDPLLLTPLRNAVVHSAWGRGKKDLPPGIARKLRDTTVVASTTPIAPSFRRDLARSMRVESVSERVKGQKFKVKDERQGQTITQSPQAPDQTRVPDRRQRDLDTRELRAKEQEQRRQQNDQQRINRAMQEMQAKRAAESARQRPQGERVSAKAEQRAQKEANAPQPIRVQREPGRVKMTRPEKHVERATAPPVRQQPAEQRVERRAAPTAAPQHQPQQKIERKQERQPQKPQRPEGGKGGGKGKGKP